MEKQVEQEEFKEDMPTFRIKGYLSPEEGGRGVEGLKVMAYASFSR